MEAAAWQWIRDRSKGFVVTLVLLLLICALAVAGIAAWSILRRRQLLKWHSELDAAFDAGERQELPRGRTL